MVSSQKPLAYLAAYFGLIQICHLGALIRAGSIYSREHVIVFPAPAPAGGWSEQAMDFLLALGITDALLILLSLLFVYRFFRRGAEASVVGLAASGGSCVTALLFALGTLPSGAWLQHPFSYGLITLLFLPFIGLFLQLWYGISRKPQTPTPI